MLWEEVTDNMDLILNEAGGDGVVGPEEPGLLKYNLFAGYGHDRHIYSRQALEMRNSLYIS